MTGDFRDAPLRILKQFTANIFAHRTQLRPGDNLESNSNYEIAVNLQ